MGKIRQKNDDPVFKLKAIRFLKIAVILGMICFLFPFCTVSCSSQEIGTLSGADLITGFTYSDEEFGPNILIAGSLICALCSFFIVISKKGWHPNEWTTDKEQKFRLSRFFSLGAAAFLLVFRLTLPMQLEQYGYSLDYFDIVVDFRFGWYGAFLAFIIAFFSEMIAPYAMALPSHQPTAFPPFASDAVSNKPSSSKQSDASTFSSSYTDYTNATESPVSEIRPHAESSESSSPEAPIEAESTSSASSDVKTEAEPSIAVPKFCMNCGAPISGKFCSNCGQAISSYSSSENKQRGDLL